jgi:type III secretory pathway lipoprotein EscJ
MRSPTKTIANCREPVVLPFFAGGAVMVELLHTTDPVRLSWIQALLADAGIEAVILDEGAGSLWGTAIARRIMVDDADLAQAKRILAQAEQA